MGGAFARELDQVMSAGVFSLRESWESKNGYKRRQREDVRRFVSEFAKDQLFSFIPGRCHRGLENIEHTPTVRDPIKMGKKIRKLAWEIDRWDRYAGKTVQA